jgi:hypothetical protein
MNHSGHNAKYYIYRNLQTGGFSVKYRGLVIQHIKDVPILITDAKFKVNEKSRQRVVRENQKNVHAFIVCDNFSTGPQYIIDKINKVVYNPYKHSTFMFKGRSVEEAWTVYLNNGECFILEE